MSLYGKLPVGRRCVTAGAWESVREGRGAKTEWQLDSTQWRGCRVGVFLFSFFRICIDFSNTIVWFWLRICPHNVHFFPFGRMFTSSWGAVRATLHLGEMLVDWQLCTITRTSLSPSIWVSQTITDAWCLMISHLHRLDIVQRRSSSRKRERVRGGGASVFYEWTCCTCHTILSQGWNSKHHALQSHESGCGLVSCVFTRKSAY